jgi:hypothetical protein
MDSQFKLGHYPDFVQNLCGLHCRVPDKTGGSARRLRR